MKITRAASGGAGGRDTDCSKIKLLHLPLYIVLNGKYGDSNSQTEFTHHYKTVFS